jgi:hypothetical protein
MAQNMTYVVRFMKALECFGDVGLLTSDQLRTASVVAHEKSLCMKIEREAFLELRKSYADRELRCECLVSSWMSVLIFKRVLAEQGEDKVPHKHPSVGTLGCR